MRGFMDKQKNIGLRIEIERLKNMINHYQKKLKKRDDEINNMKKHLNLDFSGTQYYVTKISHDLRSSLNNIIGYSDILIANNQDCDTTGCIDTLNVIKNNGLHILKVINTVFEYIHTDNNKHEYLENTISIRSILNDIYYDCEYEINDKNIKIHTNIEFNTPDSILVDGDSFKTILSKIIDNAIKFSKPNGDVIVEITKYSDDPLKLQFCIKDYGIGIDEKYKNTLFHVFRNNTNENQSESHVGTGISLALCRILTDKLGGKIWCESTLGEGSTFYIVLPIIESEKMADTTIKEDEFTEYDITDFEILIVDDDKYNLGVVQHILEKYGAQVHLAKDGEQAIELLRNERNIDLILMDLMMAVMDGYSATKMIKGMEGFNSIPVIALTALSSKEDILKAYKAGCNDYLTKPFELEELLGMIKKWLF